MNVQVHSTAQFLRSEIKDCWNHIGVRGDKSCVELKQQLHCRNCPVYSEAARALLDAPLPLDYSNASTEHFSQPAQLAHVATHSVIIFRIGVEWLALPTALCSEVADMRAIHSLPHRRSNAVLGITNVRGELLVCVSLAALLGLDTAGQDRADLVVQRLLVFRCGAAAVVFPVDAVQCVYRYSESEQGEVPATVSKAQATYTNAVLSWRERIVGVLDHQLLFYSVDRSLV